MRERKRIGLITGPLRALEKRIEELGELADLAEAEGDREAFREMEQELGELEAEAAELELKATLRGADDEKPAFLKIQAGAGGTDACDWAAMLMRMLSRYAERRGLKVEAVDVLSNEEAGIKSATLRLSGEYAYGQLRSESGVHRLVRISPFDAGHRRHTSFASVDLLPETEEAEIEINEKDLRIDYFRASGHGGQHVNVTDSAVRITHIPTGIVVTCQNERSQHQNRHTAMKLLNARIRRLREMERQKELARLYSEKGEIAWGYQIRSYTLQPFRLVKDHRTAVETSDVESVLDGRLEPFVEAFLRREAGKGVRRG